MKKFTSLSMIVLVAIVINSCEKDDINGKTSAIFNNNKTYGTMTDQEGNVYKTIIIGTQTWMAENLRTTKYRDGSPISEIIGDEAWNYLTTDAYCSYNNAKGIDTITTYGRLYNGHAVADSHNLAPTGWHVATDAEWSQLIDYLEGEDEAGGKLKEFGTTHWQYPNEATNETGFTALPGGFRVIEGWFNQIGHAGTWWSSTQVSTYNSLWIYSMEYSTSRIYRNYHSKIAGLSVRCVKD